MMQNIFENDNKNPDFRSRRTWD